MATNEFKGWVFLAQVTAVYPDFRTLDVKWLTGDQTVRQVTIISGFANFSLPASGDFCLVMGNDSGYYCLGKIDDHYVEKLAGNVTDKRGNKLKAKLVPPGESVFMNLAKNIILTLGNSGNFSLLNGMQEGISYVKSAGTATIRTLQLLGQTIVSEASGQLVNLGTVLSFVPGIGMFVVQNPQTKQGAVEFAVRMTDPVTALGTASLKLGDIFTEPIVSADKSILEPHTDIGAAGAANWLNAYMGVLIKGVEVGTVKIDNKGNISVNAALPGQGKVVINAGTNAQIISTAGTYIGGTADVPPTEPMVLGTQLMTWLAAHKHPTGMGPSGPPTPDDIANLINILSPLNKVD